MFAKRARAAAWAILILFLATSLGLLAARPPSPLSAAERLLEAFAFQALGPQKAGDPPVVIIGITEDTLSGFPYRSPIDRGFLARLIETLAKSGPAAIGLDVVLDRATEARKDQDLHTQLTRPDVPVVTIALGPETPLRPEQRQFLNAFLEGVLHGDANLARERFEDVVLDHRPRHPATGALSFPAAILAAMNRPVPNQTFPIRWTRSSDGNRMRFPIYPAEAIGLLPSGWLHGKVALIGALIPGQDEHRTAASLLGEPTFGVEIHAQVVGQMLQGDTDPAFATSWNEGLITVALGGVAMLAGAGTAGVLAVAALVALATAYLASVLALYAGTGVWLPLISPAVALTIAGGATRAWQGHATRSDRRALRTLFSRFVSEPVVEDIMRSRDTFLAGGRPRPLELTATVMFADVAGFTTICEKMAPEPLIAWLDRYIDAMAQIIIAHEGVLLRFIGDGILAVFGVPIPRVDEPAIARDARNAALCAQEMEHAMQRLNDQWATEGQPVAGLRVGLLTGPLVAGSLGTGPRMEFCLLGDTANAAARLEQLGKEFAEPGDRVCTIVVGEATWRRLGPGFDGLAVGEVALRGRLSTMQAYRIDAKAVHRARESGADPTIPPRQMPPAPACP